MENCLIADIGGTNSRFFLYRLDVNDHSKRTEVFEKSYSTKAHKDIYSVIDAFLEYKVCVEYRPKFCVIAIAGAPVNNVLPSIANIDWPAVDGDAIAKKYNFEYCRLLNDFEAVAYAFYSYKLDGLPLTQKPKITDAERRDKDTLLVLGYGTGLGTVLVRHFNNKEKYTVVSQEGGHVGIAPTNALDWDIMRHVRSKFKISDDIIVSQELMCCGVGIGTVYQFFVKKLEGKEVPDSLNAKQVFEELLKPENAKVKDEFLRYYVNLIAHSWEQMSGVFLSEGGHLLVGGIVYQLIKRFFGGNVASFLTALKEAFVSEEAYAAVFDHIHFHIYEVDTSEFVITGTINYVLLKSTPPKINKFKAKALEKETGVKPVLKRPETTEETRKQPAEDSRKVNFDGTISADFEDSYFSNILKANIMTITGFFNSRSVKSRLFIAKVISEPTYKSYKVDKAKHRFQCYKIRFLDAVCQLLVPTNVTRLLIDDIVLINDKDRLFHTREDGWYFQTFDNIICDISVVIFNNLIEKFIGNKPLLEMDKVHSKIKFEFSPTPPFNPRPEFDPERLLLIKGNFPVKSFNVLMKVLEVLPNVWIRRTNEKVEELTPVRVQSQKFQYIVHFPRWSEIPNEPMYGYFVREEVILPGYLKNSILVVDDYTIVNSTNEFLKSFPEGPLMEVKVAQMKPAVNESRMPKKQ